MDFSTILLALSIVVAIFSVARLSKVRDEAFMWEDIADELAAGVLHLNQENEYLMNDNDDLRDELELYKAFDRVQGELVV